MFFEVLLNFVVVFCFSHVLAHDFCVIFSVWPGVDPGKGGMCDLTLVDLWAESIQANLTEFYGINGEMVLLQKVNGFIEIKMHLKNASKNFNKRLL